MSGTSTAFNSNDPVSLMDIAQEIQKSVRLYDSGNSNGYTYAATIAEINDEGTDDVHLYIVKIPKRRTAGYIGKEYALHFDEEKGFSFFKAEQVGELILSESNIMQYFAADEKAQDLDIDIYESVKTRGDLEKYIAGFYDHYMQKIVDIVDRKPPSSDIANPQEKPQV